MLARVRLIHTLRARIAVAAGAAILAAVVAFAVATVLVVDHELHGSLDSALRQRAEDVAQLAVSAPAVIAEPGALEGPASGRELAVEVLDRHNRLLARSQALGAELLPLDGAEQAALRRGRTGLEDISLGGRPLRVLAAPIADAGTPASGGVVLVAADTSDIAHTTHRLGVAVVLCGIAVLLGAVLAAAVLTRRGLRPLRDLAVAAGEIERTADSSRRLPDTAPADELGELTGVLNRMLSALQRAQASERRFLADASHELRTPVTALLGNAEYLARHGFDAAVVADVRADAQRLARLVDSLLALERVAGGAPGGEDVALDALVRAVVAERNEDGRVAFGPMAAATVRGDGDALGRAIGNLVENGLVHGPPDNPVTVSITAADGVARVSVADEGPGPPAAMREHLFERFWRGEDAAARPGSGLGLAIVAAIAAQHGGRVDVEGSVFTIELPVRR